MNIVRTGIDIIDDVISFITKQCDGEKGRRFIERLRYEFNR